MPSKPCRAAPAVPLTHTQGVANRDIKLENTLLQDSSAQPLVKLADFGFSKDENYQSAPGSRVGTPAYLAPEVISNVQGQSYDAKASPAGSQGRGGVAAGAGNTSLRVGRPQPQRTAVTSLCDGLGSSQQGMAGFTVVAASTRCRRGWAVHLALHSCQEPRLSSRGSWVLRLPSASSPRAHAGRPAAAARSCLLAESRRLVVRGAAVRDGDREVPLPANRGRGAACGAAATHHAAGSSPSPCLSLSPTLPLRGKGRRPPCARRKAAACRCFRLSCALYTALRFFLRLRHVAGRLRWVGGWVGGGARRPAEGSSTPAGYPVSSGPKARCPPLPALLCTAATHGSGSCSRPGLTLILASSSPRPAPPARSGYSR